MKCAASVVTLISIVACVAFASDAKAEVRVLVSQNEASDIDLDSPSLFPSSKPSKAPTAPTVATPVAKPVARPTVVRAKPVKEVAI